MGHVIRDTDTVTRSHWWEGWKEWTPHFTGWVLNSLTPWPQKSLSLYPYFSITAFRPNFGQTAEEAYIKKRAGQSHCRVRSWELARHGIGAAVVGDVMGFHKRCPCGGCTVRPIPYTRSHSPLRRDQSALHAASGRWPLVFPESSTEVIRHLSVLIKRNASQQSLCDLFSAWTALPWGIHSVWSARQRHGYLVQAYTFLWLKKWNTAFTVQTFKVTCQIFLISSLKLNMTSSESQMDVTRATF